MATGLCGDLNPMTIDLSDKANERRGKPRVACNLPAIVRGDNGAGARFEQNGILRNLSASGLDLQIAQDMVIGQRIFVLVRLSNLHEQVQLTHAIAIQGVVVRREIQDDRQSGLAVKFLRERFL